MISNLLKLLTFLFVFFGNPIIAQEIWRESFSIPEKGVWGDEDGSTIHQDFMNISTWTLDFKNIELTSALTCKFMSVFYSIKSPINRLA